MWMVMVMASVAGAVSWLCGAVLFLLPPRSFWNRQCFEETSDGMKGLKDKTPNVLTEMKAGVEVTKAAVLKAPRDKEAAASTSSITVAPEIGKDDARKEADQQNTFRLAVIGVKEAVAEGITALVGEAITNPVLRTADGSDFCGVDEYQLHQLYTDIMEGADRPEATNIRRQYVDLAGTMSNFRETFAVNYERLAAAAMKSQGFGIVVHDELTANILVANAEWEAGQSWGNEIRVAYCNVKISINTTTPTPRPHSRRSRGRWPWRTRNATAEKLRRQGRWRTW